MQEYTYPFGETLKPVSQVDRTPKEIFILGVYASAVHARWYGPGGKMRIQALAVASEPYIFWRGENAESIIKRISIPAQCGRLEPASAHLNGPSGMVLDEKYLMPMGYDRGDAWLCDLLPETRLNPKQLKALERAYNPLVQQELVPEVTIPSVPSQFCDDDRAKEITDEILESEANILVTLGDIPLRELLARFEPKWKKLSVFGRSVETYGQLHKMTINGRSIHLLPLVHPRQAGRLGASSGAWATLHEEWVNRQVKNYG